MRFAILVVGAVATGALSVTAIKTFVPEQTLQAVRELGGDMTNFRISVLNPRKAYDDAMVKVRSGVTSPIHVGSPTPILSLPSNPTWSTPRWDFKVDQRVFASGINARIQQDVNRARDITAYGRNPMAWHGPPPR